MYNDRSALTHTIIGTLLLLVLGTVFSTVVLMALLVWENMGWWSFIFLSIPLAGYLLSKYLEKLGVR